VAGLQRKGFNHLLPSPPLTRIPVIPPPPPAVMDLVLLSCLRDTASNTAVFLAPSRTTLAFEMATLGGGIELQRCRTLQILPQAIAAVSRSSPQPPMMTEVIGVSTAASRGG
jgi:hypothetical protein